MRKIIFLFITLFAISTVSCHADNDWLRLSDFKFTSIYGQTSKKPGESYCLLGMGFFRAPRSDNADSLISDWIDKHPNAVVVPVSSFRISRKDEPEQNLVYCWLITDNDTLNNIIVRQGCYPGGTMMRPKTWEEMSQRERDLYDDDEEKADVRVYVSTETYEKFIKQIKSAETYARQHKIGIWAKRWEEDYK